MLETTKQCTRCKIIKDLSEFRKNYRECKPCVHKNKKLYKQTKRGIIATIYDSQVLSSKRRNHNPPTYTREELQEWLYSQKLFHTLYDNWKRLDHQRRYKPSVDRKRDDLGYTMNNIQLMTWGENDDKGHKDMRSGRLKHKNIPINKYTTDGQFVCQYHSAAAASRDTGIARPNITKCCTGDRLLAGGFRWTYKL